MARRDGSNGITQILIQFFFINKTMKIRLIRQICGLKTLSLSDSLWQITASI